MKRIISNLSLLLCLVYSFSVKAQVLKPTESQALLIVTVSNAKGVPQVGEKVSFIASKTKKVYSGVTDEKGSFKILVPKGDEYKVQYKLFTDNKDYQPIKIPAKSGLITFNFGIKIELPKTFTLKNVFFDTGKSTLRSNSYKALNELTEFMEHRKTMEIEIAGFTDNVGSADVNLKLSQQRANAVRNYLIKKGIAANRLTAKGYGGQDPVASNDTVAGRQQNRRTEVHIIKE